MRRFRLFATVLLVLTAFVVNGQSTAQGPSSSNDYYFRGLSRETQGDFDGAIADFTRAIELDESALAAAESKKLKAQLAETYYYRAGARRDIEGVLTDLDRAISLNPGYINAYRKRASVRQLKNDSDGAKSDLNRARALTSEVMKGRQGNQTPGTAFNPDEVSGEDSAIPINAKIHIAESSGLEEYLERAIRRKKVPVVLVTDRDKADFEIRGGYSGGGGHWTVGGDIIPFPAKEYDRVSGHLSAINLRTGYRVWAGTAETEGGGGFWGPNFTSFQKRLADKLISALKKKVESEKAKQPQRQANSNN
jgi:tetratricopeptide (TPR) repeat protein